VNKPAKDMAPFYLGLELKKHLGDISLEARFQVILELDQVSSSVHFGLLAASCRHRSI
jgi:hypothetical protein